MRSQYRDVDPLRSCSRRDVIRRLVGTAGFAALSSRSSGFVDQTGNAAGRVDLHPHFFAPTLLPGSSIANRPNPRAILGHTPAQSIETMDQAGISTAILSCPLSFGSSSSDVPVNLRAFARVTKEYGARQVADHKGRFGLFAVLPLPDIDATLREIEFVFDTLRADGVGLLTSYGTRWLGDKEFEPVFDELNRRKAVVYSHPVDAPCCLNLLPDTGPQTVEWNTDTSRAIWSFINDGMSAETGGSLVAGNVTSSVPSQATRHPNIRFLWSHAGGSLLGLVSRFLGRGAAPESLLRTPQPNSRLHHLRRFYYDTAASAN